MMDIYGFFNSADVAEHCKSIGHKFDAIETLEQRNDNLLGNSGQMIEKTDK